jgi:2-keto-4-pentenoate hydratase/2-oxohepta-3-ene-1,7-dioic acid hydratase in catechol pathway
LTRRKGISPPGGPQAVGKLTPHLLADYLPAPEPRDARKMRFVTFEFAGKPRVGVIDGEDVIDIVAADPSAPADMKSLIASGRNFAGLAAKAPASARRKRSSVKLLRPVIDPDKLICVGLNYAAHAAEGSNKVTEVPTLFVRFNSSTIAHGDPMIVPKVSSKFDYEAEIMVVIGKGGRHISKEKALDHVFGYSLFNDGSLRDFQRATTQFTAGKNFDGTGPFGPDIVTPDELPPGCKGLRIRSILNGQTMQDANTDNMIFDVATLISYISSFLTLVPGDCIATGTPDGVGFARKPPVWLKDGDTITVDVEKIGQLTNPVVNEA